MCDNLGNKLFFVVIIIVGFFWLGFFFVYLSWKQQQQKIFVVVFCQLVFRLFNGSSTGDSIQQILSIKTNSKTVVVVDDDDKTQEISKQQICRLTKNQKKN